MGRFRGPLPDVRYLQAAAEHVADLKSQSLDALGLVPGAAVLDVGCGPGGDVQALAAAKAYRVVGVDICRPMLGAARTDGATSAAFICADAIRLPFSDSTFDAVRSERMLQHLPDPASAVTEMVRVTHPGGRLVLIDTDWASLTIEGPPGLRCRGCSRRGRGCGRSPGVTGFWRPASLVLDRVRTLVGGQEDPDRRGSEPVAFCGGGALVGAELRPVLGYAEYEVGELSCREPVVL